MTVLTATLTCSALRAREDRNDADQCVPALLRVLGLSNRSSAEAWRLLHLLLRWVEPMPTPAKRRRMTRLRTPVGGWRPRATERADPLYVHQAADGERLL